MKATITSKGQITIPLRLRRKFHLNAGDQLEFDENAPVLTARRAVNHQEWEDSPVLWAIVNREPGHELWLQALFQAASEGPLVISPVAFAELAQTQANRLAAIDRGYLRTWFPDLELLTP